MDDLIKSLFSVYNKDYKNLYNHLNVEEIDLVTFTYGIFLILKTLKIDIDKIKINKVTLQDEIDDIIKVALVEEFNETVHDQNNVNI